MKMNVFVASIFTVVLISTVKTQNLEDHDAYMSHFVADIWLEGADVVRILWRDCAKKLVDVKDVIDHKEYFPKFVRCMKRKTLRALDRSLSTDIVPIAEGVNLVRFEMVDKTGNVMPDNYTSMWSEKELEEGEWRTLAMQRMAKVLRTHVIKFDLEEGKTTAKVEFRGRRRHQMMVMMMFGIVSIGMVLVPMGFQFLAVLGGKALLLAKMALILASIQGLKKIGPNPLNYGFYHSYPPYDHYEKRSGDDWPPPIVMPGTPPPALSRHNSWSNLENGNIKSDRIDLGTVYTDDPNDVKHSDTNVDQFKSQFIERKTNPRLYPVYNGAPDATSFTVIDSPTPLLDLTTTPGEVQADYTLELPYNGFRFQSPTPVVSS